MKQGLSLLLFLIVFHGFAISPSDSLVSFSDLKFSNGFEKSAFTDYQSKGIPGTIDLFIASYQESSVCSSADIHARIDACVNALRPQIAGKPDQKKIKIIYEYLHKTFLKVFRLENSFCDVFANGEYNCVSASALFGIVFQSLDIPFQVKESPRHVYLEAFPASLKIIVETTAPEKGYMVFTDDYTKSYVQSMYKQKYITKEEMDSIPVITLFNKYFFSSEDISLIQLAGLQHFNFCLYHHEDEKFEASLEEIRKTYYIYPGDRSKYMLRQALLISTSKNSYKNMEQVKNLVALCKLNRQGDEVITNEYIKSEFARLTGLLLVNNSEFDRFDSAYHMVDQAISDSALKSKIAFDYHYELSRLGFLRGADPAYMMDHLSGAYQNGPNNANLQSIILGHFAQVLEKNKGRKSELKIMDEFTSHFSFLDENEMFNSVKANYILNLSFQYYALENGTAGDNYLRQFESFCAEKKGINPDNDFVEKAYLSGAGLYFKRGNFSRSKQIARSGLVYYPGSYRLRQMLSRY